MMGSMCDTSMLIVRTCPGEKMYTVKCSIFEIQNVETPPNVTHPRQRFPDLRWPRPPQPPSAPTPTTTTTTTNNNKQQTTNNKQQTTNNKQQQQQTTTNNKQQTTNNQQQQQTTNNNNNDDDDDNNNNNFNLCGEAPAFHHVNDGVQQS